MSKDLSTQFPNPPELQPMPSTRSKIWRAISLSLTGGGLILMAVGGLMFYQQQVEANKPPPARILEVSISDLEATPTTPLPSPTPTKPATILQTAGDTVAIIRPTDLPILEVNSVAESESASISETITVTPKPTATPSPSPTPPASETVLSLADNPLLVVEEEEDLNPTDAQSEAIESKGDPAATPPTGLPLTRIVAESINLDAEVTEVGWQQAVENGGAANVWVVADYAAGWHRNSKLPGQDGNIVLSAHHNIKGEVFCYTVDLEPGDVVTLYDDAQSYDYIVEDKFIVKDKGEPEAVRHENAKWIGPFNEERLTLVTCWPYNNNTHRIIVIAKPLSSVTSDK